MNHIYKTIWNKSKNAFDVVSEAVSSKGKQTSGSKEGQQPASVKITGFFAVLTPIAAMLFVQQTLANVDVQSGNTRVYNAQNGVQVIDIATANAAGISHNRYVNYNVDQTGQVLNNAAQSANNLTVMTQLAGKIVSNKNLEQSARVILNEVTGTKRSQLSGHIEIAGNKADLVIANPYGITCTGCGFINTDKATLTTGTPQLASDGSINGYSIRQGNITINGNGLNATGQNLLQLLSRNLNVDGQLNAKQLEVLTGSNDYNAKTGKSTAVSDSSNLPTYAIDSTVLGGIYADRISLISSDQGVGVKMLGNVAANAQDFNLTAAGKIELKNKISAKETLSIQNSHTALQQVDISSNLTAKNVEIGAQENHYINLNVDQGSIDAEQKINLNTQNIVLSDAILHANNQLNIQNTEDLSLKASKVSAKNDVNIDSNTLKSQGSTEIASIEQNIVLNTKNDLNIEDQAKIIAQKNISLTSQTGDIRIAQAKIKSNTSELKVEAQNVDLAAEAEAQTIQVNAKKQIDIANNSVLKSQQVFALQAQQANLEGQIFANNQSLDVTDHLNLGKGAILSSTKQSQLYADNISIAGNIYAESTNIHAKNNLSTQSGALVSVLDELILKANKIDAAGQHFAADIWANANSIYVQQTADLISDGQTKLDANTILQIAGYLQADQLELHSNQNLRIAQTGLLNVNKDIHLESAKTHIAGKLYANNVNSDSQQSLDLTSSASIIADEKATLTSREISTAGLIYAKNLDLQAEQTISVQELGELIAKNLINLKARDIDVIGQLETYDSVLQALNDIYIDASAVLAHQNSASLNAANMTVYGGVYAKNTRLDADVNIDVKQSGELVASELLEIKAANIDQAGLFNATNLKAAATGHFNAADTSNIAILDKAELSAQDIELKGKVVAKNAEIKANTSLIQDAKLSVQERADLTANTINVKRSILSNTTNLTAQDKLDIDENGVLVSDEAIHLNSNNQMNIAGQTSSKDIQIHATNQVNVADSAVILANKNANIISDKLHHAGWIEAENISAKTVTSIATEKDSVLNAYQNLNLSSDLLEQGGSGYGSNIILTAEDITVDQTGAFIASRDLQLIAQRTLHNAGELFAQKALVTDIAGLINLGSIQSNQLTFSELNQLLNEGVIFSNRALSITANHINNAKSSALISSNGELNLTALTGNIANAGTLAALDSIALKTQQDAAEVVNQGIIQTENTIHISTDVISNENKIAAKDVLLDAESIENTGNILAYNTFNLENNQHFNNQQSATIHAGKQLNIESSGQIVNQGDLISGGSAKLISNSSVNGAGIRNTGSIITYSDDDSDQLTLKAAHIENQNISSSNLSITTNLFDQTGSLAALNLQLSKLNPAEWLTINNNQNAAFNIYQNMISEKINVLNNKGSLLLSGQRDEDNLLNQLNVDQLSNDTGASAYIYNLKLNLENQPLFDNKGNLTLHSAELNANAMKNTDTTNLISSELNIHGQLTNDMYGFIRADYAGNSIQANQLNNKNLIFAANGSELNIDADLLINEVNSGTKGELLDSAIVSQGVLNLNTRLDHANKIENSGSIYAYWLNIGNEDLRNTDIENKKHGLEFASYIVKNGSKIFTDTGAGGSITADTNVNIYANNFTNNYLVNSKNGNILIDAKGKFVNATTYLGHELSNKLTWRIPENVGINWESKNIVHKEGKDAFGNPVEWNQIALQGDKGHDDGINAGFITEIWTKNTDLSNRPDQNETEDEFFKTLTNYLDLSESASIIADNGSVIIKVGEAGHNLGGQIYASGNIDEGSGQILFDLADGVVFKNESLNIVRNQMVKVQYLAITDEVDSPSRWDVGVFFIKDGSKDISIPIEFNGIKIDDDKKINYLVNYIQKIFYANLSDEDKATYDALIAAGQVDIAQQRFFGDLSEYVFYKDKVKNEDMNSVVNFIKQQIKEGEYFDIGSPLGINPETYKPNKQSIIGASGIIKVEGQGAHFINSIYSQDIKPGDNVGPFPTLEEVKPDIDPNDKCNDDKCNTPLEDKPDYESPDKDPLQEEGVDTPDLQDPNDQPEGKDLQTDEDLEKEDNPTLKDDIDQPNPDVPEDKPEDKQPAERPAYPMDKIPSVDLTLPPGRNTEYIQSKDPTSEYLIERNPIYGENADVVGSSYLNELLGIDPEKLLKRLGDDGYEMNLIQKQLDQMGGRNALSDGYESQVEMIQRLFSNAAESQTDLGLEYGKALTEEQLKNLDTDIVWMVEQKVQGQTVLVPQVYLSAQTINEIQTTGSVLRGNLAVDMDVKSFSNNESTVKGGYVNIKSLNDINNMSGKILADDVSLVSTQGSVNNITKVYNFGSETNNETVVGPKAAIESKNSLVIDAAKDINNVGAVLKAGGPSLLKAGEDINISAIEIKKAETKNIQRGDVIYEQKDADGNVISATKSIGSGTLNKQTVTHQGSEVSLGSDAVMISGGDTVISGSTVNVKGQLYAQTGGDFRLESVQDSEQVTSQSSRSGFGVGGGVWGKQSQETKDFKGTNNASELNVGTIIVDSANKIVIEGSDLNITDKSLSILSGKKGVDILDGKDVETHEKKTVTTTYLKSTHSRQDDDKDPIYGTAAPAIAQKDANATEEKYLDSNKDEPDVKASAGANAEKSKLNVGAQAFAGASAEGDASFRLAETTTEIERSGQSTSVASNIRSQGSLMIRSDEGAVNVQGSNVAVAGALGIKAKELNVTAGKNESYASRDTTVKSIGIYTEGDASAGASASASAGAGVTGASVDANLNANAQANGTATLGVKLEKESESSRTVTNSLSSLSSGGNMSIDVDETATFHGANVSSGGNMNIDAKNIRNLAVQDTHEETRTSSSRLAGVYLSGSAEASANANASVSANATDVNPLQANASASAGVSAEAGVGLRVATEDSSESYQSVTNTGNSFTAGGQFSRTAKNEIVDEATQVDARSIYQEATTITDVAVSDSQTYSRSTSTHDARIGVGVSAEVGAGVSANASLGAAASASASKDAVKKPSASVGVNMSYSGEMTSEDSKDTQAVTSRFRAAEDITSISHGDTTLNGTQFEAGGDINMSADRLTYNAAADTHSSSSSSRSIDIDVSVGIDVTGTPDVELGIGYGQHNASAQSSNAVTGGLSSGGNITINTREANFVGTNFESAGDTTISGDTVNISAAQNTSSTSSIGFGVGVGFENSQGLDPKDSANKNNNIGKEVTSRTVSRSNGQGGTTTGAKEEDMRQGGGVSGEFDMSRSSETEYKGSEVKTGGTFSVQASQGGTLQNVDTSGAENTDISSNMKSENLKDKKSGFELNGSGSLDSQDLRDARNVRDAYNNPDSVKAGGTSIPTTTERLSLKNKEESLSTITSSVRMTDVFKSGVNSVKKALATPPVIAPTAPLNISSPIQPTKLTPPAQAGNNNP